MSARPRGSAAGLAYALAAYVVWGLFPVYFRALAGVPALEVLASRILWSCVFLALLLTARRGWGEVAPLLRSPRRVLWLTATALLISSNWLIFIWAVGHGHTVDSSVGYFVTPLVSVVLGLLVLREPMSRAQGAAVLLAGAGVAALVLGTGTRPWIALALAATFSSYGLLRKMAGVAATGGLFVETLVLAPAAAAWLAFGSGPPGGHLAAGGRTAVLLLLSGLVTALPLIWFAEGVRRLRLSTAGILLYVNPSLQLADAVLLFGEPFTRAHAVAFGCIWVSIAVYSVDALRAARRAEQAA